MNDECVIRIRANPPSEVLNERRGRVYCWRLSPRTIPYRMGYQVSGSERR